MERPSRMHFRASMVHSPPEEFFVIAMGVYGSEHRIEDLCMHIAAGLTCLGPQMGFQAKTSTPYLRIEKETSGRRQLMASTAFETLQSLRFLRSKARPTLHLEPF